MLRKNTGGGSGGGGVIPNIRTPHSSMRWVKLNLVDLSGRGEMSGSLIKKSLSIKRIWFIILTHFISTLQKEKINTKWWSKMSSLTYLARGLHKIAHIELLSICKKHYGSYTVKSQTHQNSSSLSLYFVKSYSMKHLSLALTLKKLVLTGKALCINL